MSSGLSPSRALWVLPIVIAIAALMLLPGGTVAARAPAPGPTTGTVTTPGTAPLGAGASATPTLPMLSSLPAAEQQAPWIRTLLQEGPTHSPLTSVPNLALLEHPVTGSPVNPFYQAEPAPLGLADFGLGATTYSYNTSHFLGELTLNAPPNVTDPQSTGVIEPGGAHDGYVGNFDEFGVQLNTVATKMQIPGSDAGFFWTQNVVDWNDTGIHFVDDTFNLTSATQNPFYIAPGTIYSGCDNSSAGIGVILYNYGGVFQCVGGTVPVSPASYPITLELYNNASVNAQHRTQVAYGYRIVEAGTGQVFTGVSDVVVFNNGGVTPKAKPGFSVDGFQGAPAGLFRDAELDLVGDIGGDNSVFRSISGSAMLEYSNATSGGFKAVPSAYNFGGDTGETSSGIADYWTPSHVEELNQGPAMLYGLWNADPWASVPSGSIHISGSIQPIYGFVFISNTPAVLNPWAAGARDNLSWMPTTNAGTFSTYLPPLGSPWTSKYYVQAFADGYAEKNGTPITGPVSGYGLRLTAAPGTMEAPLYMFSDAQAGKLAAAVGSSAAPPFVFSNLVVNMNSTFHHLNDYGYPVFSMFLSQGVNDPVYVNNTYQGDDSPTGNYYFVDYSGSGSSGMLMPGPSTTGSLPYFTSSINIFDGARDRVTNQILASDGYGLQVNLWEDSHAQVDGILSEYLSSGVWVGDSKDVSVWGVQAILGGTAVSDVGSTGTHAWDLVANGTFGPYLSTGVDALSSSDGTYSYIDASNGGFGVWLGDDYGVGADNDPYYYLPGTVGTSVSYVDATNGSWGVNVSLSEQTSVTHVAATLSSTGVFFELASNANVDWVSASGHSLGVWVDNSTGVNINHVKASANSVAVVIA